MFSIHHVLPCELSLSVATTKVNTFHNFPAFFLRYVKKTKILFNCKFTKLLKLKNILQTATNGMFPFGVIFLFFSKITQAVRMIAIYDPLCAKYGAPWIQMKTHFDLMTKARTETKKARTGSEKTRTGSKKTRTKRTKSRLFATKNKLQVCCFVFVSFVFTPKGNKWNFFTRRHKDLFFL